MLARYTVIMIVVHFILEANFWGYSILFSTSPIAGSVVLFGFLAMVCFVLMSAAAAPFIRRQFFEYFRYLHSLYLVGVAFAMLHNPKTATVLIPVATLYFADIAMRWYQCWRYTGLKVSKVEIFSLGPTAGTTKQRWTRITMADPGHKMLKYGPGDWISVCVPAISPFEWHPFSISS